MRTKTRTWNVDCAARAGSAETKHSPAGSVIVYTRGGIYLKSHNTPMRKLNKIGLIEMYNGSLIGGGKQRK